MIGQSNMAGRGDLNDVPPIRNPHCFMLRMGRWQPMSEPINPDRPIFAGRFRSGVSLAASFADAYARRFNREVGLIPCADGGTRLEEWLPGTVLFDHAVLMTRLALRTSELKGILWHQGENDSTDPEDLLAYPARFQTLVQGLRQALQAPSLPVLAGELADPLAPAWKTEGREHIFNEQLAKLPEQISNLSIVPAADLPLKDDGIHFSAASCRKLGLRYFDAYVAMTQPR